VLLIFFSGILYLEKKTLPNLYFWNFKNMSGVGRICLKKRRAHIKYTPERKGMRNFYASIIRVVKIYSKLIKQIAN